MGLLSVVKVPEDDMGKLMGDEEHDSVRHLPRQVDDEVDDGDAHATALVLPARASPLTGYLSHTPLEADDNWIVGEKRLRIDFGDAAEDGGESIPQVHRDYEPVPGALAGSIQPLADAGRPVPVGCVVFAHGVARRMESHSGLKASTSSSPERCSAI